jgi:transposase InsO family protein
MIAEYFARVGYAGSGSADLTTLRAVHALHVAQYASADYRKAMQSAGFHASMSRKADCYDNAPMESFFHTLKTELVHHQHYATREEAKRDIFAYIEGFYNRTRRHSAIGYLSPIEMEQSSLTLSIFSGEDHLRFPPIQWIAKRSSWWVT